MATFTLSHDIECDEDTYWFKCVFDDTYNRRLYSEKLHFPRYERAAQEDDGKTIRRTIKIDPPVAGVPGPIRKALGDSFSYTEEGSFDRATKRYTFKVTPSTFAEKTTVKGVLYTKPGATAGTCKRIVEIEITVKVFGIGGMVEDKIGADLRTSYDAAADFTNVYTKTL